jgi:hypothetical protein
VRSVRSGSGAGCFTGGASCESHGRASKTRLKGVSAARWKRLKPASFSSLRHVDSGTWFPSAGVRRSPARRSARYSTTSSVSVSAQCRSSGRAEPPGPDRRQPRDGRRPPPLPRARPPLGRCRRRAEAGADPVLDGTARVRRRPLRRAKATSLGTPRRAAAARQAPSGAQPGPRAPPCRDRREKRYGMVPASARRLRRPAGARCSGARRTRGRKRCRRGCRERGRSHPRSPGAHRGAAGGRAAEARGGTAGG